ncbi:MAG TPA: hypothetical protein VKR06_22120 [Ktedonosporobacter sp.]|nr:hypothetical protein [Ktedonosporobacter sp.]
MTHALFLGNEHRARVMRRITKCSSPQEGERQASGSNGLRAAAKRISAAARVARSDGTSEAKLLEGGHAIVQTNFLYDLAVFNPKHRCAGESHLSASGGFQRSNEEVVEGRTGVRAAAFPATNHILTLGNQVSRAPEVEVRKRFTRIQT